MDDDIAEIMEEGGRVGGCLLRILFSGKTGWRVLFGNGTWSGPQFHIHLLIVQCLCYLFCQHAVLPVFAPSLTDGIGCEEHRYEGCNADAEGHDKDMAACRLLLLYLLLLFLGMVAGSVEVGLAAEQTLLERVVDIFVLMEQSQGFVLSSLCFGSPGAIAEQSGMFVVHGIALLAQPGNHFAIDGLHLVVLAQQAQSRCYLLSAFKGLAQVAMLKKVQIMTGTGLIADLTTATRCTS